MRDGHIGIGRLDRQHRRRGRGDDLFQIDPLAAVRLIAIGPGAAGMVRDGGDAVRSGDVSERDFALMAVVGKVAVDPDRIQPPRLADARLVVQFDAIVVSLADLKKPSVRRELISHAVFLTEDVGIDRVVVPELAAQLLGHDVPTLSIGFEVVLTAMIVDPGHRPTRRVRRIEFQIVTVGMEPASPQSSIHQRVRVVVTLNAQRQATHRRQPKVHHVFIDGPVGDIDRITDDGLIGIRGCGRYPNRVVIGSSTIGHISKLVHE